MKKYLIILLAFLPASAFAQSATSTITLPDNFNSSIFSQAAALLAMNSIGGYAAAIIGVILAAIVIEILIGALRNK